MEKVLASNKVPRYIKIAVDIANRIDSMEFVEGDKLKGRSTLASEYNVSPETIRRSASLLEDMDVIKVSEKSGIFITSSKQARVFIDKFSAKNDLHETRDLLKRLRFEKANLEKQIDENLDSLLEYTLGQKKVNLGASYELSIPRGSHVVGKTTNELKFWYNTGATITAVKRGTELFISPGPHMSFLPNDIVYFVCAEEHFQRVKDFIAHEDSI
ncbi:TrkA C-terminal domain-containing protein [Anaerotignum sp. MB30-C6]|uniref:TrkA C-terminal domain-containing protein n=1 Tax=Anaerotignum sp. MB30-C6 TaxID=3070814 RepID=UPI0027DE525D|nr:TrkA C-terminal domain-containing protein [Anaerotignum sp. MB30-C6]WMI82058.1 TrkA C-terminal domain-containing protein [Anaerotignum sp. MB30-C6]